MLILIRKEILNEFQSKCGYKKRLFNKFYNNISENKFKNLKILNNFQKKKKVTK